MADDISKVVREMREQAQHGPTVDWRPNVFHFADRIEKALESATTPAEVDDTEAALRYIRDWCPDSVKDHVATLARQLAVVSANRLTMVQDYCDMRDRAEQAESQLAEAKAEIEHLAGDVAEYQRNIDAESFALTKAESALAAATRRVEEVEGLLREAGDVARVIRVLKCRVGELWPSGDGEDALQFALEYAEKIAALKEPK